MANCIRRVHQLGAYARAVDTAVAFLHRPVREQDMKIGIAVVLAAAANTVVGEFQTRTAVFACSN
jgi:hypothetical protein